MSIRRVPAAVVLLLLVLVTLPARGEEIRAVVFVANAEAGTVSIVDAETHATLRTIDVIPDGPAPTLQQDPVNAAAYPLIVAAVGENWRRISTFRPTGPCSTCHAAIGETPPPSTSRPAR